MNGDLNKNNDDPLLRALRSVPVPKKSDAQRVAALNRLFAAMDEEKMHASVRSSRAPLFAWFSGPRLALAPALLCLLCFFAVWLNRTPEIKAGMLYVTGDTLALTLHPEKGTTLVLAPHSKLTVVAVSAAQQRFRLEQGSIELSVRKRAPGQCFEVQTANALCRVVGTRFEVEFEQTAEGLKTLLTVTEGVVRMMPRLDESGGRSVPAGKQAVLLDNRFLGEDTASPVNPSEPVPPIAEPAAAVKKLAVPAEALAVSQEDPVAAFERNADEYRKSKSFTALIGTLNELAAVSRDNGKKENALWEIATVRARELKDFSAAESDAQRYLDEFPAGIWADEARLKIAELRLQRGQKREAVAAYRAFLEKPSEGPITAKALYGLAMILGQDLDQCDEASRLLLRLTREQAASPEAEGALYWRAEFLNRLGRVDESKKAFKLYLGQYPNGRWASVAQEHCR